MITNRHWIQQIQALLGDRDKPIFIVGTHSDLLVKQKLDPNIKIEELVLELKKNPELTNADIRAFIPVSLASGWGLIELKRSLVEVALTHPQIGVMKAKVPGPIIAMQQYLEQVVKQNRATIEKDATVDIKYYMGWTEFENLCSSKHILLILFIFFFLFIFIFCLILQTNSTESREDFYTSST